jgi:AraC-like DNA-binding protein
MDILIKQAMGQMPATCILPGGMVRAGWIMPENHPATRIFRKLENYHMLYLIRGQGRVITEQDGATDLTPGSKLDRHPQLPHTLQRHADNQWLEFFITLSPTLHQAMCDLGLLATQRFASHIPVNTHILKACIKLVENLHQPINANDAASQIIALLSLFQATATHSTKLAAVDQIQHAAHLLTDMHKQQITLPMIAKQIGMTYESFRKQFTRQFGKSPQQYRIEHRINQAQHHLLETDISIEQLAALLGYNDVFCFSRQFKTVCGISPTQYRQRVM